MDIFRFLATVHHSDIFGDKIHWAGAIEADGGHDVIELAGLHVLQHATQAGAFYLKYPGHFAAGKQLVALLVVQRNVVQRELNPMPLADDTCRLAHDRQRRQPQEIDLQQTDALTDRELELRHRLGDHRFLRPHHRQVGGQRLIGDDNRCGVRAGMSRHTFQRHRIVQQFPDVVVRLILRHHVRHDKIRLFGITPQRLLDGHRLARNSRDQLGDPVHFVQRHVQRPAHIAHCRAGLHASETHDLRHVIRAILGDGVADHFLALVVGEVKIEVGHGDTTGVQEALENQVIHQRVDARDTHRIGYDRTSPGAAYVVPDAAAARVQAKICDDQEVDVEAHLVDDLQFVFLARLHIRVICPRPVTPAQPLIGHLAQIALVGMTFRNIGVGQVEALVLQIDITHLGDPQGVGKRAFRQIHQRAENIAHLLTALEIIASARHTHPVAGLHQRAGLHTQQHIVVGSVARFDVMNIVGCYHAHVIAR